MASRVRAALDGNLITATYNTVKKRFLPNCDDVVTALCDHGDSIQDEVASQLKRMGAMKWYIAIKVKFNKIVNNQEVESTPTFHGKTRPLLHMDEIEEQFSESVEKIMESLAKWVSEGSGWTMSNVEKIDLFMVKYQPLHASSYIPTPKKLSHSTQGLVNIKNTDNKCFLWSILAGIHGPFGNRHYEVGRYRRFEHELNMEGIPYPVQFSNYGRFEKQNPNISINVFGFENDDVYPLWITKEKGRQYHINLLVLNNEQGNSHYCLIKNLNRFLSHLSKHHCTPHYCHLCLHRFKTQQLLDQHLPLCTPHGAQKTRLPSTKEKWMSFSNYSLTHKVPFTVYADFESFVVPMDVCLDNPNTSHCTDVAKHEPSGYCYVIVNGEGKLLKPPKLYSGPNVVDHMLNSLLDEAEDLLPWMRRNVPVNWTLADRTNFSFARDCHLCHKPLGMDKVVNHDHMTGRYLGAAHDACNLKYRVPKHIPVFFHNLRGYDCHHLVQGLGKFKEEKMTCIAKNSEQYISVSLESLRFLDSLQFLSSSLDNLVKNLAAEGPNKFEILNQCMGDSHMNLLLRKGVFPYSWLTNPSKLEQDHLPPREHFFNDLTKTEISEEDYKHAQTVWTTFNMSTMQDYHDFYLKTDVLLLADVFENFRKTSMQYYGIDPCNVYSAPGLAWQAMLKMTDIRLELLTDINQHLFIEKGIRGGVAMIPHRYAQANNPLLPDYNPKKPTSYLMYLDCNNLYGTAMCSPLPQCNFMWLAPEEISVLDITTVPDNSSTGYILEVDLHYPPHLHRLHSDYPLAPERRPITEDMLSPFSKTLLTKLNLKQGKTEKLLTTLEDKKNYVVHYRALKLYLQLGLQLTKIHRVLKFYQTAWLSPFIEFNTQKRQAAKNEFEKDFFKLINNATYGKSLENVRSRIDFKLVANKKQLVKWTASPRLKSFFPYNKDLAGLTLKKQTIMLNRPVYVGLTVLDISKLIMYSFHYGWTIEKYGDNVKLCMTDTDSLLYHIKTADIYTDMKRDSHLFDTSNYPQDNPNYSEVNKKVLGKFKDEHGGQPAWEIVGLRAKCYSVLDNKLREKNVAKGVPRTAIKLYLKHHIYKQCLFNHLLKTTSALTIHSHLHHLYTQNVNKLSLSPFDDKRYILEDGVHTLAYGDYRIPRDEHHPEEEKVTEKEDLHPPPPPKRARIDKAALEDLSLTSLLKSAPRPSPPPSTNCNRDLMELVKLLEEDLTHSTSSSSQIYPLDMDRP